MRHKEKARGWRALTAVYRIDLRDPAEVLKTALTDSAYRIVCPESVSGERSGPDLG